jgi:hypothetical protein
VFPFQLNLPVLAPFSSSNCNVYTNFGFCEHYNPDETWNKLWSCISFPLGFFLLPLYAWRITWGFCGTFGVSARLLFVKCHSTLQFAVLLTDIKSMQNQIICVLKLLSFRSYISFFFF